MSLTPVPVGNDIQVNTTTASDQISSSVAALAGGGFVVTWSSLGQDGSDYGIYGQRYAAAGVAVGSEFQVNTTTASNQITSSVAALAGGGFVVTWSSYGQDGDSVGIYGQRYTAAGAADGGEFRVNTTTASDQIYSSVAALSGGGFIVTWQSHIQDGSELGIYGQRYDDAGVAVGSEFQVNTTTASDQFSSSGATLAGGGFVVSWSSFGQDGNGNGIYGQRYDAAGVAVGSEFQVNTTTASDQISSSVAALAGGGFVVTWSSFGQDGNGNGIYGQRYDAAGVAVGSEFQVNTVTPSEQEFPSVAALAGGGFVVTWTSNAQDGDGYGIYGQRFGADGIAQGTEFKLNQITAGEQINESFYGSEWVAQLADGRLVATWTGQGTEEVFVRLIDVPSLNAAPTVSANPTLALAEDSDRTLTAADFNFADTDAGDQLEAVRFDSLPANGQLWWDANGGSVSDAVLVTTAQVLSRAEIDAGHIFFRPEANANGTGYATLTYSVSDGEDFSGPGTMTFDVAPVSDAPVAIVAPIVVPSPFSGPAIPDPFGAPGQIRPYSDPLNLASVTNGAQVAVVSSVLSGYETTHDAAGINDGYYGNASAWIPGSTPNFLKIDLGQVSLIDTITFGRDRFDGNVTDRPPGTYTISVATTENDYATGDTSNDGAEYTPVFAGTVGSLTSLQTIVSQFTAVNARYVKIEFSNGGVAIDEVQVYAPGTLSTTLAAINEDATSPAGATVSTLFNGNFSDAADGGADTFAGIAISGLTQDATKGIWQYSIDGSTWNALGNGTPSAAITLEASTHLRFMPAADYNGPATALSANLIESGGPSITNGASIDLTGSTGGTSVYSADTVALSHTINPVNDAPVISGPVTGNATEDGTPVTLDALANSSDADADTTLSVINIQGALPAGVSVATVNIPINSFVEISVPVDSQDAGSHVVFDDVWSVTAPPFPINDASGIGYLINPATFDPLFTIHDHQYVAPFVPDPSRVVITFQFATATIVDEIDVIEHANGITQLHGYVGNSLDSLTDIGAVFGSLGDITGSFIIPEYTLNTFDFDNTLAGTYFQVVIDKVSYDAGYALYRMYPQQFGNAFTLDPSDPAYQHLAEGQQTIVTVDYDVFDGTTTTPASVSWTVTGTNDAPTAFADVAPIGATSGAQFLASTEAGGPEFWRVGTDGSLVQLSSSHLMGGIPDAGPTPFNGATYVALLDPASGQQQIYKSGTGGALTQITALNSLNGGISVDGWVEHNGDLYFRTPQYDAGGGFSGGLFKIASDDTVTRVTDDAAGGPTGLFAPTAVDDTLYFAANTATSGLEWFSIDAAGVFAQVSTSDVDVLANDHFDTEFNGSIYFNGRAANGDAQIYRFDPSDRSITQISFEGMTGDGGIIVDEFQVFNGVLYAGVESGEGYNGGLFKIGTNDTFDRVTDDSVPGSPHGFFVPYEIDGTLYFDAFDTGAFDPSGEQWWKIDSNGDVTRVTSETFGTTTSPATILFDGKIYWSGADENGDSRVYAFDPHLGTGTDVPVSSVNLGFGGIVVDSFFVVDDTLFFNTPKYVAADNGGFGGGLFSISTAGIVTQIADYSNPNQPFGLFFPFPAEPGAPVLETDVVTIDVLANDVDPDDGDGPQTFVLQSVDIASVTGPVGVSIGTGTATIIDNKLVFNPGADFDVLAPGQTATVVINYTMADAQGATSSSTATITLTGENDAPVALLDGGFVGENQVADFFVLGNDSDVDAGDSLTVVSITTPTVTSSNGTVNGIDASSALSIVGNHVNFNPGTLFDALAPGQSATVALSYTIQDSHGATASAPLNIFVTGANDAPVALLDGGFVGENQVADFFVLGNDSDVDAGDSLTVVSITTPTVSSSNAAINGINASSALSIVDNHVEFNPGTLFDALAVGQSATVALSYTIQDGHGATASAPLTITVTGANDAPNITSNAGGVSAAVSVVENSTAVTTVVATDPDAGHTLAYSITGGADAGLFTINSSGGALAFATAPDFEATADADGNNVYEVTVQVSDGNDGVDTQDIAVSVTNAAGISPPASNAATITGTNEEDVLTGLGGANTLQGLGGNDILSGGGGADALNGGLGNDTLTGGTGGDAVNGGAGDDTIAYTIGDGADTVDGGDDLDTLNIVGTAAANTLGVIFNSVVLTNFEGGTVTNVELITADLLGGIDTLTYAGTTADVTVDLAAGAASGFLSIASVENVTGGSGDDTLAGNSLANALSGGSGNDSFLAGVNDGNDSLIGGGGTDTYDLSLTLAAAIITLTTATSAEIGSDNLASIENFIGSQGNDTITAGSGVNVIDGQGGNDTITGGTGNDTLFGGAGDDIFGYTFGDGADTIDGGIDFDTLNIVGTTAADTLDVVFNGSSLTNFENGTVSNVEAITANLLGGTDTLNYAGTTANITVNLGTGAASGFLSIAGVENVTGGSGNDTLTGNGLVNVLNGGAGNDSLDGGLGNDTLAGGAGNDTYFANNGDTINEGSGTGSGTDSVLTNSNTFALAANVENLTFTGVGNFTGTGNGSNNIITGASGNDALSGAGGNDTLIGAGGNDTLSGGAAFDTFVFAAGFGADQIQDFDFNPAGGGQDFLDISAFGITTTTFASRVGLTDLGANILVTIDGDANQTIALVNAQQVGNITQNDFILAV